MNAGKFFIYFLDLFLTTMAASGLGFAISASVEVFAIANLLIAMCYVLMMVRDHPSASVYYCRVLRPHDGMGSSLC